MVKPCSKCGAEKPLTEFYRQCTSPSGHRSQCKDCIRIFNQSASAKAAQRKGRKKYDSSTHGKARRKAYRQTNIGRENALQAVKKHQAKYPEKRNAAAAVNNAIQSGGMIRPNECSRCGSKKEIEAHHWGYEKENWLDVAWLCRKCHRESHKKGER